MEQFNATNNTTFPELRQYSTLEWPYDILHTIMLGVISAWVISTNSVFLIAILKGRRILKISTLILTSLSAANLLSGLTIPLFVYSVNFRKPFDPISAVLQEAPVGPAVGFHFHVVLLTVDRFIAIIQPLKYNIIVTYRRAVICIVLIWLFVAIRTIPVINYLNLNGEVVMFNNKTLTIYRSPTPAYGPPIELLFYVTTSLVFVCMYVKIYRIVQKHRRQISTIQTSQSGGNSLTEKSKKILVYMLLFYVITWLPVFVCRFLRYYGKGTREILLAELFTFEIAFFYMSVTLAIYAWSNRDIRYAINQLLCCLSNVTTHYSDGVPTERTHKDNYM